MKCPTCKRTVADDAAVCPGCDTVLDPSLLDAAPPPDDDEGGDPTGEFAERPSRPARPARPASKPGRPAVRPATSSGVKRVAGKPGSVPPKKKPAPQRAGGQRMPEAPAPAARGPQPKRDWREEVSQEDWNEMPQGPRPNATFVPDKSLDPEDVMGEFKRFVYELPTADKLAFFGLVVMLLACFFPWKETVTEGDVLGLLSSGVVVLGAASVALGALAARARKSFAVNSLVLWVLQLAGVGIALLWCVVYVRMSWDSTLARSPIGNYEMWVSKPSFGVILAFLAGVVAGLGTVFGLKETN